MVTCLQVYNINVSTSLVNEAFFFIYYGFGQVVVIMLANWCCSLLTVWVQILIREEQKQSKKISAKKVNSNTAGMNFQT